MRSKFKGSLLGVVLGDCLGSPYEGEYNVSKVVLQRFFDKLTGPYFKAPIHQYTDDTVMTICVAESLIEKKGFDDKALAKRFVSEFYREPKRGYGANILEVFHKLKVQRFEDIWKPAKEQFDGSGSYGNGGAMRIAPVALYFNDNYKGMLDVAQKCTELTHTHRLGVNGALLQCAAIHQSLFLNPAKPLDVKEFTSNLITKITEIEKQNSGLDFEHENPYRKQLDEMDRLLSQENVHDEEVENVLGTSIAALYSVPTAVYCFLRAQQPISNIETQCPFQRTIQYAISLGGDTDTIASMAGAIAGAFYGHEVINKNLLKHCEGSDKVMEIADKLCSLSSAVS